MNPLVSIIVPIYNVEKYLSKCINSIVNQTLANIEIILIDDGSTDFSGSIADQYAKNDSRIKVIHKNNEGQGAARNIGIDLAKGDYIGFVDSDDWIDFDMYEKLYKSAIDNNACIAVCNRKVFDENGNLMTMVNVGKKSLKNIKDNMCDYIVSDLLYNHTVVVYNKIYKSEIIKSNKIYFKEVREVGSEDFLFNYQVLFYIDKIISIDNTNHNQLAREGSTAREYKLGAMERTAKLIENIYLYAEKINKQEIGKKVAPIILIFFQQWNYDLIKKYGNNLYRNMLCEQISAEKNKYFRLAEKEFIFDKDIKKYIYELGYSEKGRMFINLYMSLSLMKLYKLAVKIRTMI